MGAPRTVSPTTLSGGTPVGGSGTLNTIPRWTGATTLGDSGLIDNGTAIYTTTRDFGIGTASPSARLHAYGSAANGSVAIVERSTGDATVTIGGNTSNTAAIHATAGTTLAFGVGASYGSANNFLNITSAGNVGIGTATPQARAHVSSSTLFGAELKISDTSQTSGVLALGDNNTTARNVGVWRGAANSVVTGGNVLNLGGYTGIVFACSANAMGSQTERMRISAVNAQAQSQVAIGTSSFTAGCSLTVQESIDASQSGQGLKLPATPGNTDPNTLDCYADGGTANSGGVTWTPTLKFGGATTGITYTFQIGRYTRIGNMVFAQCHINLSSKGSATGVMTIDGLPASANLANMYGASGVYTGNVTFGGYLSVIVYPGSTAVALWQSTSGAPAAQLTDANFANNSIMIFTVSYPVT